MRIFPFIFQAGCVAVWLLAAPARAAEAPLWRTNQAGVDVDIKNWELPKLLRNISAATGWRVFMEPGTTATVTARFKNLPVDDALSRLLPESTILKNATNGVAAIVGLSHRGRRGHPGASRRPASKPTKIPHPE